MLSNKNPKNLMPIFRIAIEPGPINFYCWITKAFSTKNYFRSFIL